MNSKITRIPSDYSSWLVALKQRIQSAQQGATLSVNCELVLLYRQIGVTFWIVSEPKAGESK